MLIVSAIAFCLAKTPVQFAFTSSLRARYDVKVGFDGYLPMLGGQDAKIEVTIGVGVEGQAPDADGHPKVASEVKEFQVLLNGVALPFSAKNVQAFFPRNTVCMTPEGKVVATDAVDRPMPVRLPGLDSRRFPDISYLPVEFPTEGIEVGKPFTFTRRFGDSDVQYEVTPTAIADAGIDLKIRLVQKYTTYEDDAHNTAKPDVATVKVENDLEGEGEIAFDRVKGLVKSADIEANAIGHAEEIATKKVSERHLHTSLKIALKSP